MSSGVGLFKAAIGFFRKFDGDDTPLLRQATHVAAGPRGRKVAFVGKPIRVDGVRVSGFTTESGNVFISGHVRGDPKKLAETVRHELAHSVFTPRTNGGVYLKRRLGKSHLFIYMEEAAAETYGTKSLRRGLEYPIRYGEVASRRLAAEGILLGGGAAAIGVVSLQGD